MDIKIHRSCTRSLRLTRGPQLRMGVATSHRLQIRDQAVKLLKIQTGLLLQKLLIQPKATCHLFPLLLRTPAKCSWGLDLIVSLCSKDKVIKWSRVVLCSNAVVIWNRSWLYIIFPISTGGSSGWVTEGISFNQWNIQMRENIWCSNITQRCNMLPIILVQSSILPGQLFQGLTLNIWKTPKRKWVPYF